ncbi:uncharacterized protein LOC142635043 [Castanea sativa]|uniref:uncharacterized protein LOC142635043 n=1 Tax=Castanea sativa TaxID=21020 RepID=UPI003F64DBE4
MLLSEFNIVFVTRKAIKGQAIAYYLADQPLNDLELSESLFLNEDVMALELEPDNMEPCLIPKFRNITFAYLPQAHNQFADALATLTSMVKLSKGDDMHQLRIEVWGVPAHCMNIEECMNVEVETDGKPWYHDIKAYIRNSEYPSSAIGSEKKFIQCKACQFFLS